MKRNQSLKGDNPKSVGFVRVQSKIKKIENHDELKVDPLYNPFIFDGTVSFIDQKETKPIRTFRDTRSVQSFILDSVLL